MRLTKILDQLGSLVPGSVQGVACAVVLSTFLVACSGGGGGSSNAGNSGRSTPVGTVSDSDASDNSVSESSTPGASVGITASASDPDSGDTVTYSLDNDAAGLFAIDATTGAVSVTGAVDFETASSHLIRVRARSSDGSSSTADFIIAVLDDPNDLVLSVGFPASSFSSVVHFTGSDIDVSGRVADPTGGQVTVEVTVGTATTQAVVDIDGNWRAEDVPIIQAGRAIVDLHIMARSDSGHSARASVAIATQIALLQPAGMGVDPVSNRAFVVDESLLALFELNLDSGDRTLVSGLHIGTGPDFSFPGRLAVDTTLGKAFVRGQDGIIEVNLATGERTLFFDPFPDSGRIPDNPWGDMSIDRAGNRLIVVGDDELVAFDLVTGVRTILSGSSRGSGPEFEAIIGVVAVNNTQALVMNFQRGLYSVDLNSGNRFVVSSATNGSGPELYGNMSMTLDPAGNRVFVVGSFRVGDLMSVDLLTGNRTDLSDGIFDPDYNALQPASVAWDARRETVLIAAERAKKIIARSMSDGTRSILTDNEIVVGSGENLGQVHFLSAYAEPDRVFYGPTNSTVGELNLHTGHRTLIYDDMTGTGPQFNGTSVMVYDDLTDQVYLRTGSGIIALDLSTGNRTLVSDPPLINGPSIGSIWHMVLDRPGNRILGTETDDRFNPTIVAVDLTTGLRETLSGPFDGVGPNFRNFSSSGLAIDQSENRLLVPDLDVLYSVDMASGDRTVLADLLSSGSQPLGGVRRIFFDPESRRCFLLDINPDSPGIHEFDLISGVSTVISGENNGQGIPFDRPTDILVDVSNGRAFLSHKNGTEILIVNLVSGDRAIFATQNP